MVDLRRGEPACASLPANFRSCKVAHDSLDLVKRAGVQMLTPPLLAPCQMEYAAMAVHRKGMAVHRRAMAVRRKGTRSRATPPRGHRKVPGSCHRGETLALVPHLFNLATPLAMS